MSDRPLSDGVAIVTYRDEYRAAFERLNREWLERYVRVEPLDLEYMTDPRRMILEPGGQVFFAVRGGEVVGTCAAIRHGDTVELAKLAVDASERGRGLGRRLAQTALEYARGLGVAAVTLSSNSQLREAIALYESMGFRRAPLPPDLGYETADVYMELALR